VGVHWAFALFNKLRSGGTGAPNRILHMLHDVGEPTSSNPSCKAASASHSHGHRHTTRSSICGRRGAAARATKIERALAAAIRSPTLIYGAATQSYQPHSGGTHRC